MKIERQRELLRQFFVLRDAHTTTLADSVYRQQAAVYTDPKRAREELAALFRGRPPVAGLSADLPATGDCFATEVAGVPLLLVRGEDASVRALICGARGEQPRRNAPVPPRASSAEPGVAPSRREGEERRG